MANKIIVRGATADSWTSSDSWASGTLTLVHPTTTVNVTCEAIPKTFKITCTNFTANHWTAIDADANDQFDFVFGSEIYTEIDALDGYTISGNNSFGFDSGTGYTATLQPHIVASTWGGGTDYKDDYYFPNTIFTLSESDTRDIEIGGDVSQDSYVIYDSLGAQVPVANAPFTLTPDSEYFDKWVVAPKANAGDGAVYTIKVISGVDGSTILSETKVSITPDNSSITCYYVRIANGTANSNMTINTSAPNTIPVYPITNFYSELSRAYSVSATASPASITPGQTSTITFEFPQGMNNAYTVSSSSIICENCTITTNPQINQGVCTFTITALSGTVYTYNKINVAINLYHSSWAISDSVANNESMIFVAPGQINGDTVTMDKHATFGSANDLTMTKANSALSSSDIYAWTIAMSSTAQTNGIGGKFEVWFETYEPVSLEFDCGFTYPVNVSTTNATVDTTVANRFLYPDSSTTRTIQISADTGYTLPSEVDDGSQP